MKRNSAQPLLNLRSNSLKLDAQTPYLITSWLEKLIPRNEFLGSNVMDQDPQVLSLLDPDPSLFVRIRILQSSSKNCKKTSIFTVL
jgi:hypothetical protein